MSLLSLSSDFLPSAMTLSPLLPRARRELSLEMLPSLQGGMPPMAPAPAKPVSLVMPSVLDECRKLVSASLEPSKEAATPPRNSSNKKRNWSLSAFFEESGVVLLGCDAPVAADLTNSYVPALDKFLVSHSINVHETIDVEVDPRKFHFVTRVREVRDTYQTEVATIVEMYQQFSDALRSQLATQALIRIVSRDEHSVKCMMLMNDFRKLLDNLLEMTRVLVAKLEKSFLSIYADKPGERAARLSIPLVFGDAMFALERTSRARKSAGRIKGGSALSLEQRQQDESEWLKLWQGGERNADAANSEDVDESVWKTTTTTTMSPRKRSVGSIEEEDDIFAFLHSDCSSEGTALSVEDDMLSGQITPVPPPMMIVQRPMAFLSEKKHGDAPTTNRSAAKRARMTLAKKEIKLQVASNLGPIYGGPSFSTTVCPCPPPLDESLFMCQLE